MAEFYLFVGIQQYVINIRNIQNGIDDLRTFIKGQQIKLSHSLERITYPYIRYKKKSEIRVGDREKKFFPKYFHKYQVSE